MRGVGVTRWLVDLVPQAAVPLLVALTFLGDPVFLVGVVPVVYWLGPRYDLVSRENGARLLAVALGGLALTVVLKYGFALPRPPDALHLIVEGGFGFPSGHATGSAAVYGALAALTRWRTRATRYALATGMIVLVALTRVLLGVHYLVDVVVGAAAGVLFAWTFVRLTAIDVRHGFRTAALVALATPLVAWPEFDAAASVGGALGALVAWEALGDDLLASDWTVPYTLVGAAFVALGGLAGFTYVVEPAPVLVVVVMAVTGAGFVGLPVLADRWRL